MQNASYFGTCVSVRLSFVSRQIHLMCESATDFSLSGTRLLKCKVQCNKSSGIWMPGQKVKYMVCPGFICILEMLQ